MSYPDVRRHSCLLLQVLGVLAVTASGCGGGPGGAPDGSGGALDLGGAGADLGSSGGSGGETGSGGASDAGEGSGGSHATGGHQAAGGQQASGGEDGLGGDGSGGEGLGGEPASGGTGGLGSVGSGGETGSGGSGSGCAVGEEYDDLAEACLVPIQCDDAGSPFGGGVGTALDPYRVCSPDQLAAMADVPTLGTFFVLAKSLDLSSVTDFVPIADANVPFEGTFDGAGRALVGLIMGHPYAIEFGLFGHLGFSGTISDLHLIDFELAGYSSLGLLVGWSDGTVTNVHVSGSVFGVQVLGGLVANNAGTIEDSSSSAVVQSDTNSLGGSVVGGLAGGSSGVVTNSIASGDVLGRDSVGGLLGVNAGTIEDSHASGMVEGHDMVGGLVGESYNEAVVTDCEATGDVSGVSQVGGLLGYHYDFSEVSGSRASGAVEASGIAGGLIGAVAASTVVDCVATGSVTGSVDSGAFVGGLIGSASGTQVARSRASGSVSGLESVGGLLGGLTGLGPNDDSTIELSAAHGAVSATGTSAGGLVGRGSTMLEIQSSYSLGDVECTGVCGGLVGQYVASVVHSYAFGIASGTGTVGGLIGAPSSLGTTVTSSYYPALAPQVGPGTPLSPTQFATQGSFAGWDFVDTWTMSASLGRPVLKWE